MARRLYRLTNFPVAALGIAAAGVGAAALSLGNGDAVVERGFERALASMADRTDGAESKAPAIAGPAVAGSEQYWLTHVVHDPSAMPATKPVAVGDRITITSGGRDRVLHVVTIDMLDSSLLLTSSQRPARLLLVTCRDQANPESRPVRFLIEADDELPTLSAVKAARTL
jgi:hypothetical protein